MLHYSMLISYTPPQLEGKVWWFPFHQTPDVPEALVDGKERMYLSWFYHNISANPAAITQTDIDEFVNHYSALAECVTDLTTSGIPRRCDSKYELFEGKLTMPVLAVGAGYIPAFGGDVTINYALYGMQKLAQNVTGVKVPLSGHWIPEDGRSL